MIDQERLRVALEFVRTHWCNHINMSEEGRAHFRLVADAAESTLPKSKTVWDIRGVGRAECPRETQRMIEVHDHIGGCIALLHQEGYRRFFVTSREVPA